MKNTLPAAIAVKSPNAGRTAALTAWLDVSRRFAPSVSSAMQPEQVREPWKRTSLSEVAGRGTPTTFERGSAYLELAFVLPFFLAFVMGIVEFGKGFNIYHNLTNACREGARQAAMQDSNQITAASATNIRDRVVSYMNSLGLDTSYYPATAANPNSTNFVYAQPGQYPNGAYLLVNQGETIGQKDANGNVIPGGNYYVASKVEVRYPYTFPMFSRVIRLLLPSTAFDGTIHIGNSAMMEN
ncbi:MAG TPA: TadE family protein [Terriglobia bacterium]|nr:TadE family protein [Terriglobia bacterium]